MASARTPTAYDVTTGKWLVYRSASTQREFYFHTESGETTYTPPPGIEFSHEKPANSGTKRTQEHGDSESGPKRLKVDASSAPPSTAVEPSPADEEVAEDALRTLDVPGPMYTFSPHEEDLRRIALTNMYLRQRNSFHSQPQPHPLVEVERRSLIGALTQKMHQMCIEAGLRKEPDWIVVRWLFIERLTDFFGKDVLLPYTFKVNAVVRDELENEKTTTGEKLSADVAREICGTLSAEARHANDNRLSKVKMDVQNNAQWSDEVAFSENRRNADQYDLEYGGVRLFINKKHYTKLEGLFKTHNGNETLTLNTAIFNLLCRYDALGGPGYQAAVPVSLFRLLQDELDVFHECFASPLNCTLSSFGSAFFDTDKPFGSKGSFFECSDDLFLTGGSFEANPPFVEATMLAMSMRMEKLLMQCTQPLSFIIFVPGWSDTPSFYMMRDSRYNRCPNGKYLLYRKRDHAYQDGFQHRSAMQHRTSQADSFVFFLQNEAGTKKWPITPNLVDRITQEFRRNVAG